MPYFRIKENWHINMKTPHTLFLDVREGFFWDTLRLYVNDSLLAEATITVFRKQGYRLFDIDGRTLELRWLWDHLGGNPLSIILMHKDRILIQYGSDAAAKLDFEE